MLLIINSDYDILRSLFLPLSAKFYIIILFKLIKNNDHGENAKVMLKYYCVATSFLKRYTVVIKWEGALSLGMALNKMI